MSAVQYIRIRSIDIILWLALLISLVRIFTCYISWGSVLLMFLLFAWALYKSPRFKLTYLDIVVSIVLLYELILPFTSVNPYPGYTYAMMSFYLWAFYFICRLCIRSISQLRRVLFFLSIVIFCISLVAIISFVQFRAKVLNAGFSSLYEFRFLLTPWGNTINLWTTFLIVFMGIVVQTFLVYRKKIMQQVFLALVFCSLMWNGLASFSRTLYVLLCVTLVLLLLGSFIWTNKARLGVLFGASVMTIAVFCVVNGSKDLLTTLSLNTTISQQRSTSSRLHTYTLAEHAIKDHLIFGVGNGNYTLAVNNDLYENDDISYTNFASSGYLQLLIEKGIVGVIVWFVFFVILLGGLIRCRTIPAYWAIMAIGLLLLKEVTFAVFLDFPGLQCWLFLPVLGVLNISNREAYVIELHKPILGYVYVVILMIFLTFYALFVAQRVKYAYADNVIANVEAGLDDKDKYISLDLRTVPYLINRAGLLWGQVLTPDDSLTQYVTADLKQAIASNPLDNIPLFNLALLYLSKDELTKSADILQPLVSKCPDNSLFRIGLAKLFYKQGDTVGSATQYGQAILLNPRILDDSEWTRLSQTHPKLFRYICAQLHVLVRKDTDNPIQMAKNGKIFLSLGDTMQSKLCLERTASLLPNLGKVWYNLGVIADARRDSVKAVEYLKKADLFCPSDSLIRRYCLQDQYAPLQSRQNYNVLYLYSQSYGFKFRTWYKNKPYDKQIFMSNIFP